MESMNNLYSKVRKQNLTELMQNLKNNNPEIQKKTALLIEKIRDPSFIRQLLKSNFLGSEIIIPRIIGNLAKTKKWTDYLISVARDKNEPIRIRKYAIESLGRTKNKNLFKFLIEFLNVERDYEIRQSIINALVYLEDDRSEEILIKLMKKEESPLRNDIIWALGKLGKPEPIKDLIELLSKSNEKYLLKKNIINALGKIANKEATNILIEILKDQNSGLEKEALNALGEIKDKRALNAIIKEYLNPKWILKKDFERNLEKITPHWKYLLKDYDIKIYHRSELPPHYFNNLNENKENWHYGYLKKSHYALDSRNRIIGCLNLIFLSIYKNTYLYYLDTIEVKKQYRRMGIGTKLLKYVINKLSEKYQKFNIFLLVAKCTQYKMKFFRSLGFTPIKLRKTGVGVHCIMCYPFTEDSEENCERMFKYFNWREEKREFLSSDCKYAQNKNPTGLYWCEKKQIYVTCLEKQNCPYYVKSIELYSEKKIQQLVKDYKF
ncbi:MAG: GNAT family N-acetyltransferase [Promethearchaeota archaeon]